LGASRNNVTITDATVWRRARHFLQRDVVCFLVEFANFGEFLIGGGYIAHGLIQTPQFAQEAITGARI